MIKNNRHSKELWSGVENMLKTNLDIKKKILVFIGLAFLLTIVAIGGVVFYQFNNLQNATGQNLQSSLLTKEKERISNATEVMAKNLELIVASQSADITQEELKTLLIEENNPVRYGEAGYFFIYDYEGNTISQPTDRELEGTNRWNEQDPRGKYLFRELSKTAQGGGGFVEYYYLNPNTGQEELKYGYVEPIAGTNYFVGSGTYASIVNGFLETAQESVEAIKGNTLIILGIVFGAALLVMGILIYFIADNISKPLKALTEKMALAEEGDLSVNVDYDENREGDEINQIKSSFNNMIKGFRNMISQIAEASDQLAASSQELSASSEEISASAEQVGSAIQEVASGSEEQSAQIEETKSNVDLLVDEIDNIGNRTEAMDLSADNVIEQIKKGNQSIKDTINEVTEVKNQSSAVAKKINELGEISEKIDDIVELISGIAAQTNLLALNAAIEAARAGEAGRGFSVVADEIRDLAEESSNATEKIAQLIDKIQVNVKDTISQMGQTESAVDNGVNSIKSTEQSFDEIFNTSNELTELIKEIYSATNQMNKNSKTVKETVNEIASVSQEVSSNAEEVAASSEEQSASTQEIVGTSEDLAEMAQNLSAKVAQFKI